MITSWTGAAEQLAADARAAGFAAAAIVARAWRARCDPDATRSLVQAAHALTGGDALPHLWDRAVPFPSGADYAGAAGELAAETAVLAKRARDMAAACESARGTAISEHQAAQQRAAAAQRRLGGSTEGTASALADLEAAQQAMRETAQVIGDCDAALELTAATRDRLGYAAACLERVPDDVADTYEIAFQLVRDGGTLPWSGDFLTGTAPAHAGETGARRGA